MRSFESTYSWYAIYTKSRAEKKLYQELCVMDIECYLPLKKELRKWSDRVKWIEEPLIRSYVFVKVSEREYYDVLNSPYAVRYVSFEGKAAPICETQIEALRVFLEQENNEIGLIEERLKKGKKVEVISGSLKGIEGEVVKIKGRNRIVIRFDSLGTCVYTDIDLKCVKLML